MPVGLSRTRPRAYRGLGHRDGRHEQRWTNGPPPSTASTQIGEQRRTSLGAGCREKTGGSSKPHAVAVRCTGRPIEALADINRDGFLDVVRVGLRGSASLLTSYCDTKACSVKSLEQPAPNRNAIGAEVEVEHNGTVTYRRLRAGGFRVHKGPPEIHLGLGDLDTADLVQVRWPDGRVDEWTDIATRQHLHITRRVVSMIGVSCVTLRLCGWRPARPPHCLVGRIRSPTEGPCFS